MPKHKPVQLQKKPDSPKAIQRQPDSALGLEEEWDGRTTTPSAFSVDAVSPRQVLALQRMVGNQAVQRMLLYQDEREETTPDGANVTEPPLAAPVDGGKQRVQRTPVPKISSFSASAGSTLLQRRTILASKPGHVHEIKDALSDDPKKKLKQIQKAKRRQKYKRFDDLEVDDDPSRHITDGKGEVVWYQVAGTTNQYVLASKVLASFNAGPTGKQIDDSDPELDTVSKTDLSEGTGEIVNEVDNAMVDVLRGYTLKEDKLGEGESLSDSDLKTQSETTIAEGVFWAGGGALGMVNGILGMASSLKDLTSNEKSTWEKVEAAFNLLASGSDIIGGAQGISGGVAQLVNTQSTEGTSQYDMSSDVSSWAFGFQGMFGALSSGIKTILDVVSLIRMLVLQVSDKETFDRDEWLAKAGSLLTNALETAKGVITTFRTIWEIVNDAVTGVFEAVLPGIDIAISAVKTIFQGYYLAKSAYHWFRMAISARKAKKNLQKEGFDKRTIKESRKFYSQREGVVANTEHRMGKNAKGIDKRKKKIDKSLKKKSKFDWVNNRRLKSRNKWRGQIRDLQGENRHMGVRTTNVKSEMSGFETAPRETTTDQLDLTTSSEDEDGEMESMDNVDVGLPESDPVEDEQKDELESSSQTAHPSRLQLSELNLSKELSSANAKRVARQAIHIGANLIKIAGSIVTIVGGTGAPAGVALKAVGAGVDISLPFFRSIKQFGRNKAGKAQAKGKKNVFTKVFNANKSTVAKMQHRKQQAVTILMMVADLNKYMPKATTKPERDKERKILQQRAQNVETYMYAAGVSPKKLYRANGKPAEQVKMLVEAMCKRELF